MNFRKKIEAVLVPLVAQLRRKLALLPTLGVLNYYQLRIDCVQTDKGSVPDSFMIKWPYRERGGQALTFFRGLS